VVQGREKTPAFVDIGDGLVAAFKIESHNHPSYVEPFQGATTGVGGILRDIFTMGARRWRRSIRCDLARLSRQRS